MTNTVGIIGYGRMGQVLSQLLIPDFIPYIYDIHSGDINSGPAQTDVIFSDLYTTLKQKTIFIAVPIREFKKVILEIAPLLQPKTTIIDVCSVKTYPVKIMEEYLPKEIGIIATHPLFGPDSIKLNAQHKMMMHPVRDTQQCYPFWKSFFSTKNIKIIEMTPQEHDLEAAQSQGVTHFLGRILHKAGIHSTNIDTLGFQKLLEVMNQTNNDSWELFYDLQNFNPFTKEIIEKLKSAMNQIEIKIEKNIPKE